MKEPMCGAKGSHQEYNFVRDIYCSLYEGHKGRHIGYWNHIITDRWEEGESGEIGGPEGCKNWEWEDVIS